MTYMVFDMMYCEGNNLLGTALVERKEALQTVLEILQTNSPVDSASTLTQAAMNCCNTPAGSALKG